MPNRVNNTNASSNFSSSQDSHLQLNGKTVIICDDSALQRRKLKDLYNSIGLQCIGECSNGLECLNLAESIKPDLVSLDVLMPVMHGLETVKYLREASFKGFIIIVSALGSDESLVDYPFGALGPDAIFSKRDSRESFKSILEQMFESQNFENNKYNKQNKLHPKKAS